MGIDDESSHPELCSEVAGGVTRNSVSLFREPDAGNLPVRFDEREQEPEPRQTGLRRRGESQLNYPPGDYSPCACSRLYSRLRSKSRLFRSDERLGRLLPSRVRRDCPRAT
jgi:hypothetical protein